MAKYGTREWKNNISEARRAQYPSLVVRFYSYVVEVASGCWEFTGAKNSSGYGVLWDGEKLEIAQRLAWRLARGPISDGASILHHCDNPPCVLLDHLYSGTHADNMIDRTVRGRSARGEENGNAKFPDDLIEAARQSYLRGEGSYREVAERFGMSKPHLHHIVTGKNRKHRVTR